MNFLNDLSKEELTSIVKIFDIQIAIVILLIVFVTKSLFARVVINIANKILKRKKDPKESGMYKPLKWIYVFSGVYLAVLILPVTGNILVIMKTLLKIVLIIFITQLVNNVILVPDSIFSKKGREKTINETVGIFVFKILRVIAWIVAVYIIFLVMGFDLTGLITGLGIGTVIISLAAQDTVKSLLSGFVILSDKPFVIGDWISAGNYAGSVVDITFRSTRIKCADNSTVTIPNSIITEDYVVNWSKLKARRINYTLTLDLDTTSTKIKEIVKEIKTVLCSKAYTIEDSVYVGFETISSYSADVTIFLNVKETDYKKYLDVKQELNFEILKILEKEGVELAYPTETVHVKNTKI